jgi:hypothetical protein
MTPEPITVTIKTSVRLELSMAGDEIVARLYHNKREVLPTIRAVANLERVRAQDGLLHVGRCQFAIPKDERRAVADFLIAAQISK